MAITDLGLGCRGDKVRSLHEELRELKILAPTVEFDERVFGAGTQASLRLFQASAGLAQTGELDALTHDALNKVLRVVTFKMPRVEGRLVTEQGLPSGKVKVRLRRRPVNGGNVLVDETTTDAEGFYRFETADGADRPVAMELLVVDAEGAEVSISKPMVRARRYERFNLVVPSSMVASTPEWDRMSTEVKRVLGGFEPLSANEDDDLSSPGFDGD